MVATTSQNPNEFSFIILKETTHFWCFQPLNSSLQCWPLPENHPQKTSKSFSSCAATAARATSCLLCRKRARVFNAGAVAVAVPRRTRARAAAGVSRGCRKETSWRTGGFRQDMDDYFVFWCPLPPQKKIVTKDNWITVFPKACRILSVVKLEDCKQLILM